MAEMVSASLNSKPRRRNNNSSSCVSFTACFGISGGVSKPNDKNPPKNFKSGGRKKNLSWFSWSWFRIKKSASKTVPVPVPVDSSNKGLQQKDSSGIIVDWKPTIVEQKPEKTVLIYRSENQKAKKEKHGSFHNTILEPRAKVDTLPNTCPKPIIVRRKSELRYPGTQSGSPIHNHSQPLMPTSQSLPSTPFNRRKLSRLAGNSQPQAKKPASQENKRTGKFDSLAGLSILMVALALLLTCGRICAILFTSLWFYAVPRLIAIKSDNVAVTESKSESPDFDSEQYKKRVILEGLLDRNHRHPGGAGVSQGQ